MDRRPVAQVAPSRADPLPDLFAYPICFCLVFSLLGPVKSTAYNNNNNNFRSFAALKAFASLAPPLVACLSVSLNLAVQGPLIAPHTHIQVVISDREHCRQSSLCRMPPTSPPERRSLQLCSSGQLVDCPASCGHNLKYYCLSRWRRQRRRRQMKLYSIEK